MSPKTLMSSALYAVLAGCATAPVEIQASYVDPVIYEAMTCDQLEVEWLKVTGTEERTADRQRQKAIGDATAVAAGLFVSAPALMAVRGNDEAVSGLANLRGHQNALQETAFKKQCGVLGAVN